MLIKVEPVKHAIVCGQGTDQIQIDGIAFSQLSEEFLRWCCKFSIIVKIDPPILFFAIKNISSWIQDLLLELEHRKALCFSDQLISTYKFFTLSTKQKAQLFRVGLSEAVIA